MLPVSPVSVSKESIRTADPKLRENLVPHYSVAATSVEDIQAAVKFASERDLYLVVKNTGHDQLSSSQVSGCRPAANSIHSLGRSSGQGAFSIWTHNLRGRRWTDSYVVKGAPKGTKGVCAVILQPGEQWLGRSTDLPIMRTKFNYGIDVYRAASKQSVIVVGGTARTVGAAGGWLLGGGHSAFANLYGLGVDSKAQFYFKVGNLS